jgi:predicted lactoylglutathione lyase
MHPSEIKLFLQTANLIKSHSFYTALGTKWLGDGSGTVTESQLADLSKLDPESTGLPHLAGRLANLDLYFYLDGTTSKIHTMDLIMLNFDNNESILEIVRKLKSEGNFSPNAEFNEDLGGVIFDPDGRKIHICGPSPWRL